MLDETHEVAQTQPTGPPNGTANGTANGTDAGGAPGTGTGTGAGTGTGTGTGPGGGGSGDSTLGSQVREAGAGTAEPNAGAAAGGSGGGGGGGGGGALIDAWGVVSSVGDGILTLAINTTQSLIDVFSRSLLTIPAAGELANPASWFIGALSDPYWLAMAGIYISCTTLGYIGIVLSSAINIAIPRGKRSGRYAVTGLTAIVLIALGFGLLNGYNNFWNEATMMFAPSGEEFLATPGNSAKFGAGLAAVVGLFLTGNAVAIAIGVVVHAAFVFLTYALVALWPISVMLHFSDAPVLSRVGTSTIVVTLLLGPLQWLKAALLRVLFELPIQPSNPESFLLFVVIIVGVALAFTGVPYVGLKRMLPRTVVGAGIGKLETATHGAESRIQERAPSRAAVMETLRGTDSSQSRSKSRLNERSASASGSGSGGSSAPRASTRRSTQTTTKSATNAASRDTSRRRSRTGSRSGSRSSAPDWGSSK